MPRIVTPSLPIEMGSGHPGGSGSSESNALQAGLVDIRRMKVEKKKKKKEIEQIKRRYRPGSGRVDHST